MDNIVIIGSSGHARVVIDIVEQQGEYKVAGLIDRFRQVGEETMGYAVMGREEDLPDLVDRHRIRGAIVAIGDNFVRSRVVESVRSASPEMRFVSAVHPGASVAPSASIGEGTVVMAGAVVNPCCSVGQFCIINTNSSLDHDSVLGDFASLAPGATTGGHCRIGEYSAIGVGANLVNGVEVGNHTVVGSGALLLNSVESLVTAYGVPATVKKPRKPGDRYL